MEKFFFFCLGIVDAKNMNLYVGNELYFIVDQYQKDTCSYVEDAYCYFHIDVDRILLHKKKQQ